MSSSEIAAFPSSCQTSGRLIVLHKCHASSNFRISMNMFSWSFDSTDGKLRCEVSTTVDKLPSLVAKHNSLSYNINGVWSDSTGVSLIFSTCLSVFKWFRIECEINQSNEMCQRSYTYCWLSIWNRWMLCTICSQTQQMYDLATNPIVFCCSFSENSVSWLVHRLTEMHEKFGCFKMILFAIVKIMHKIQRNSSWFTPTGQ